MPTRHNKRKQRNLSKNSDDVVMPVPVLARELPENYAGFLIDIKSMIRRERLKTLQVANSALIFLYWRVGKAILENRNGKVGSEGHRPSCLRS